MARAPNQSEPAFHQARNELFSHILRCGVIEASVEHQKEWFDDTMEYLTDRYLDLSDGQLDDLRELGERYCRPVINRAETETPTGQSPAENEAVGAPS